MVRFSSILAILGLGVAVAACQSPQQVIGGKEDMMAAAGFKFVPANTAQRQASFKSLPPHRFSRQLTELKPAASFGRYDSFAVIVQH